MTSQFSEYLGRAHSEIKLTLMITNNNLMRHYINVRRLGLITNSPHMIISLMVLKFVMLLYWPLFLKHCFGLQLPRLQHFISYNSNNKSYHLLSTVPVKSTGRHLMCIIFFDPYRTPGGKPYCYPHFALKLRLRKVK